MGKTSGESGNTRVVVHERIRKTSSEHEWEIVHLGLFAFYFLLIIGEYVMLSDKKQMRKFRLRHIVISIK